MSRFFVFFLLSAQLFGQLIPTFYGEIDVNEPVLLELIHCPAMQRLKHVHQYGISYYTKTYPEEYTRFDHSLGVFAILRLKDASLEEQIAGLLHDVSHTAFSHVADWVYANELQAEDYQSSIYEEYLALSGIEAILHRYGYNSKEISPEREDFIMLEQPLPNLCADRIDYNIQGAYFQHFITKEEAHKILLDLSFEDGKWLLTSQELAMKLARFSLFMTASCWGSAGNFMTSHWLAQAILQGFELGILSPDEFHFGTDGPIWEQLSCAEDPLIQEQMQKIHAPHEYFRLVDPSLATTFIPFKCRVIDPWMRNHEQIVRLSSLCPDFHADFAKMKQCSIQGWPIEVL